MSSSPISAGCAGSKNHQVCQGARLSRGSAADCLQAGCLIDTAKIREASVRSSKGLLKIMYWSYISGSTVEMASGSFQLRIKEPGVSSSET